MNTKTLNTTVNLYPRAQEAKNRLMAEWDIKKVFSAALLLFDEQPPMRQKELIRKIVQGSAEEKKVKPDVRYGDKK